MLPPLARATLSRASAMLRRASPGAGVGAARGDRVLDARDPAAPRPLRGATTDRALPRPAEVQHPFGATERDVEQPLLLVHRLGGLGVRDRDEAAFEAGDEHGVELEPLRAVEREQLDRVVRRLAGVVAAQRGLQEPEEAVDAAAAAVGLEVLVPESHQRVDVLAPFLGQVLRIGGEVGEVLGERTPRAPRAVLRRSSSATFTSWRSRKRPPPRTRNGTPARESASSNRADCAFTR